ncbi:hypothetical protein P6F26_16915 [Roseibacterium sp. SDUM158017]|uniref:DUF7940 domain-containing protein n=1 Tax=Roseicyclus salinarum TaxID=3036773 RepID=UPI002414E00B|nr:hypothetical protein [Roseibacterium sp. SDUM158017]MDG4650132.1 hypothetical protein [Roseibacterium sp. SDUM158017]
MIHLIPNWRAILWRSWAMRFTYLGALLTWGAAVGVWALGDIPLSPLAVLILTALITPACAIVGRIIDQGIGDR